MIMEEHNHNIGNHNDDLVTISVDNHNIIEGNLSLPNNHAKGIVVFIHGSGSSRHSSRNKYVSQVLNNAGIATLLVDLLTLEEEKIDNITKEHRFDIGLLSRRLIASTDWILHHPNLQNLRIGYFGASTGAAAALVAAVQRAGEISAIVSRGGRPDLAGEQVLNQIEIPTLLIVGENDKTVIKLNQGALKHLTKIEKKKKMVVIQGATHLFEEAGALEEVARRATGWFECFFLEEKRG
jgi:putative phosphoribosyl transferase